VNPRLKSALLIVFALTTVATGILAWQQNRTFRNTQLVSADTDRTALEKRLADAEHRAHALQNELDALKAKAVAEDTPSDEPPAPGSANNDDRRGRTRGPGGGNDAFMAMMNDPKVVQLMNSREKLMLDSRYASLFKSLMQGSNLTPQQIDAFKDLLVEKQNTTRDVMMSARTEGITDRSEVNKLVKSAQAELDAQIQSTLGASGFEQYQQYEKTAPQRNLVNQLSQSLSYTSSPLTDAQSQQLVQILADNSASTSNNQRRNNGGFGGEMGGPGGFGGGSVTISDAAVAQAQSVLGSTQLQALTNLQQQQKAQQELAQAMRAARQNTTKQATSTATTTSTAKAAQ
jgi:hypothetical protein